MKPIATSLPTTIEEFQLALEAAFAGGQTLGKALANADNPARAVAEPHKWVGLTKEDRYKAIRPLYRDDESAFLAVCHSNDEYEAIEAKLKEKNQ